MNTPIANFPIVSIMDKPEDFHLGVSTIKSNIQTPKESVLGFGIVLPHVRTTRRQFEV